MRISFKDLQANCKHQGWLKEGHIKMCSFKDRKPAKCWDDWQECTEQNCPLAVRKAAVVQTEGQMSIEDYLKQSQSCPWTDKCINHPAGCKGQSYWCKRFDSPEGRKEMIKAWKKYSKGVADEPNAVN